jgi:hypothetical protein
MLEDSYFLNTMKPTVLATVFSNGISSFVDSCGEPIPALVVIQELMSFKNYKGAFVQRRMKAVLRKT